LSNLYLGKNILIAIHEDIIKAIIRLLNNYSVDEFDNQVIPTGVPIVVEFSFNTHEFFNGYYLSSLLLERNTDHQQKWFPTGFGNDNGKFNSTKDAVKQSPSPDVDFTPYKEKLNLPIEQNFIDTIDSSTDANSELFRIKIADIYTMTLLYRYF
jgi:hypothetical protein